MVNLHSTMYTFNKQLNLLGNVSWSNGVQITDITSRFTLTNWQLFDHVHGSITRQICPQYSFCHSKLNKYSKYNFNSTQLLIFIHPLPIVDSDNIYKPEQSESHSYSLTLLHAQNEKFVIWSKIRYCIKMNKKSFLYYNNNSTTVFHVFIIKK